MLRKILERIKQTLSGTPQEPSQRALLTEKWQQFARQNLGCSQWIDLSTAEGVLVVQEMPLKDVPSSRQETVVGWVEPAHYLPDPTRIVEKAVDCRARNILVTAKDPTPCNGLEVMPNLGSSVYPISLWVSQCQKKGFSSITLDFDTDGVVTILAGRRGSPVPGSSPEKKPFQQVLEISEGIADKVLLAPHSGWTLADGSLASSGLGTLYAINRTSEPVSLRLEIDAEADIPDSTLKVHLDFCYLQGFTLGGKTPLCVKEIILTPGGHGIQILPSDGTQVKILKVQADGVSYPNDRFLLRLPCDQYQRHRVVADVVKCLAKQNRTSVLDVGGGRGTLTLFLPEHQVTPLDRRAYDVVGHVRSEGERLPFGDASFEIVSSVDVLEHVPASQREGFLCELWRVAKRAVILACPFHDDRVASAERLLADFAVRIRGQENAFLMEHIQNGLPDFAQTQETLETFGASTVAIPNGYFARWFSMMVLRTMLEANLEHYSRLERILAAYNKGYYALDNAEPCYRRVLVACKQQEDRNRVAGFASTLIASNPTGNPSLTDPRMALAFYGIPVSEAFEQWYRDSAAD
ncbi:MAG TPA: class I SAM-dependent methyltransferase, partial [bacterium]|nr:class I SAM-dependent methyltransferase [bacterium]